VWTDALAILDGQQREWKQMVARDLDQEDYFSREHIKVVLAKRSTGRNTDPVSGYSSVLVGYDAFGKPGLSLGRQRRGRIVHFHQ
jgi:hypothetical protein